MAMLAGTRRESTGVLHFSVRGFAGVACAFGIPGMLNTLYYAGWVNRIQDYPSNPRRHGTVHRRNGDVRDVRQQFLPRPRAQRAVAGADDVADGLPVGLQLAGGAAATILAGATAADDARHRGAGRRQPNGRQPCRGATPTRTSRVAGTGLWHTRALATASRTRQPATDGKRAGFALSAIAIPARGSASSCSTHVGSDSPKVLR